MAIVVVFALTTTVMTNLITNAAAASILTPSHSESPPACLNPVWAGHATSQDPVCFVADLELLRHSLGPASD